MHKKLLGHILAFFSVFFWSSLYVSSQILLQYFGAMELLILQFLVGYIFLLLIKPTILLLSFKEELLLAIAGFFGICIYNLFLNLALTHHNAPNVSIIIATIPIFVGFFSFLHKKEKIHFSFYLGAFIALIGIFILHFKELNFTPNLLGDFFAFIATFGWVFYALIIPKIPQNYLLIATRKIIFYGIIFTFIFIPFFPPLNFNSHLFLDINVISNLIFLAIFSSCLCFIAWNKATLLIGETKTNLYVYLTPIFTLITSFIFVDKNLEISLILGAILVLIGVYIAEKN
ncbi:hypothetical protein B6S12_07955 [Helicobacter valdiviensis]|uniref:EamA domain-containing protein n=1 Tax=Helicobacter valdiviensis TaxID=1458358 RepID=A0A2W6MT57_9HELI|nr:DMT family transporter [Helicobacter valdiviensis]PZT47657.1 hypothetical protein B6S12_07955 [Helicobacter valdiviensis]